MTSVTQDFSRYVFSAQPGYVESETRQAFAKLMLLRTIVIYCFDPRAAGIPDVVAKEFGEVYPGSVVTDAEGNEVGADTTLLTVVVAGGRAMDALRSITVGQHRRARSPHSSRLMAEGAEEWVRTYEVDEALHEVLKAGRDDPKYGAPYGPKQAA